MYKVPENLIFLSGCHGCGKDYIINRYFSWQEENNDKILFKAMRYNKCEMTGFEEVYERQVRRIAKYAIDFKRIIDTCIDNPDRIIITDRCPVLDPYCYVKAFAKLNFISNEIEKHLLNLLDESFIFWDKKDILSRVFLIKDASNTILNNIKNRNANKWNEDDINYTLAVIEEYNKFNKGGVGYLCGVSPDRRFDAFLEYVKIVATKYFTKVDEERSLKHLYHPIYNN